LAEVIQILIHDHHAMVVETISDEHPTVGQKRDVLRFPEMLAVGALDALFSERADEGLHVVREDVDLAERLVDDPDLLLRIVEIFADAMRPWTSGAFEQLVPLIPDLDGLAVRIERIETVLPDSPLDRTQHVDANRSGISEEAGRHGIGQTVFA